MVISRERLYWVLLPTPVAVISILLVIAFVVLSIAALVFASHNVHSGSYYILVGASGVSVLCSIFLAFCTAQTLHVTKKAKKDKWNAVAEQTRHLSEPAAAEEGRDKGDETESDSEEEEEKGNRDTLKVKVAGRMVMEWQTTPVRNFTPAATFTLYLCYQCFFFTFLCVCWTITIANNSNGTQTSAWPYLASDFLAAILAPLFLVLAGIFGGVVFKFITKGTIDARHLIPSLLPGVAIHQSKTETFWVIADTFYYQLNRPEFQPSSKRYKFAHAWDKSLSTWCLTIVIASSLIIGASYFVDAAVVEIRSVNSCHHLGHEIEMYDCFSQVQLEFVNCSDPENAHKGIHCYKFQHFLHEADPIDALLETVVLYFVTVEIFAIIFKGVRVLLRFKPSKIWGKIILVVGLTLLVLSLLFIGFAFGFALHLALVRQLQLVLIGIEITVTGVLLVRGNWWEKASEPVESIELVSLKARKLARTPSAASPKSASEERKSHPSAVLDAKSDEEIVVEMQFKAKTVTAQIPLETAV